MFNFLSGGRARTSNRTRRSRQQARRHLTLDHLESRRLLSNVTASLDTNGELLLTGDDNGNVTIDIHELQTGQVAVTGLKGTTINSGLMFTTQPGTSVVSIDLTLMDGNDTVYLHGEPTAGQIPTVTLALGMGADTINIGTAPGGTADPFKANSVTISATASVSPGGGLPADVDNVDIENSTINTLVMTLGDASGDSVILDSSFLGSVNVTEGSGSLDSIQATNSTLGAAYFTQSDGPAITVGVPIYVVEPGTLVEEVGLSLIRIPQNDVINVQNDEIADALTIKQGDGDQDQVYVNDISGVPSSTGEQYATVAITQGGGQGDLVDVASSAVLPPSTIVPPDVVTASEVDAQSLTITQGLGNFDQVNVGSAEAVGPSGYAVLLYGKPTELENFPGPSTYVFSGGNLKITQGDGESDSVEVTNLIAKNATIIQGNGPVDTVSFEDSQLDGNLIITVGDGNYAAVYVGDVSPVFVAGQTSINVSGFDNTINLGGAGTPADLETNSLNVEAGWADDTVVAENVVVDDGQGFIDASGAGNTLVDSGGNSGLGWSPVFGYEFVLATPVLKWANPADITYGTALDGTQLDATANVAGTFTYTPAAGTVLGAGAGQTLSVTFTPNDTADYNSVTATATINVSQAQLTVAADGVPMTYGNSVPTLTDTILGFVNGYDASVVSGTPGLSTTASSSSHPGSYPITVDVSGLSATNYSFAAQDGTLTIGTATPTVVSVNPVNITYGTALANGQLSGTAAWTVNGSPITVAGTFTYTSAAGTVLNASNSGQSEAVSFTPADTTDYTSATGTATINVSQATPTIYWTDPANILYGTALSGTQLDATANVAGTFTYTQAAATVLGAGNNQSLSVSFTPTDTTDHTSATGTATINVLPATPTISWTNPANILYGTALSATQLDATASWTVGGNRVNVPGSFTYTPAAGAVLSAGNNQTLSVSFTPTDSADSTNATATAKINVAQHATTTTLFASTPSCAPGQSVTFTAAVAAGLPSPYLPTGSVQFQINGVNAGSPVPLTANDTAAFTTTEPASGSFKVTAVYSAFANFTASTSPAYTETVLSPGVYAVGSTLYVVGANSSDYARISPSGSKPDGSTGLAVVATLNNAYTAKAFSQTFTAIHIFGYGGNDNFQLFPTLTLPTTVVEGNGNNYLLLARGNDSVTLGAGSNQVFGGNGSKTITASDAAGTSGYISLGNGNENIQLGQGNDHVFLGSGNNTVTAGNGKDSVTATGNGNNIIIAGNGNDYINTGNGTDLISLGSGNENIRVGNGQKTIVAGGGNDYVHAGSGNVSVTLLGGNDNVQLGAGDDTVSLGNGNDYVAAGNGNNNVTVGNGNDNVRLGNGSDVIVEGNGNDYVAAGNGSDLVGGGLGQHTIQLGKGNDILIDGSATVVNSGDSLRQILSDWNASSSASVNARLKVMDNTSHPNVLKAGGGWDWFFYTYSKDVTNKKSTDRRN